MLECRGIAGGLAVSVTVLLASCQFIGPRSISEGRTDYNQVIQDTSMTQTLANIVRVHYHEPLMVFDVTEVDAASTFQGSITGGATNIGAEAGKTGGTLSGQVGNVGGTLEYQEQPTIRYTPLVGQALVGQLTNPVSVDAIAQLTGSDWPDLPVLTFAMAVMAPRYEDQSAAQNTIAELDSYGVLQIAAGKSNLTGKNEMPVPGVKLSAGMSGNVIIPINSNTQPASPPAHDSLDLFLLPFRSAVSRGTGDVELWRERRIAIDWIRLLWIYAGSQAVDCKADKETSDPPKDDATSATNSKDVVPPLCLKYISDTAISALASKSLEGLENDKNCAQRTPERNPASPKSDKLQSGIAKEERDKLKALYDLLTAPYLVNGQPDTGEPPECDPFRKAREMTLVPGILDMLPRSIELRAAPVALDRAGKVISGNPAPPIRTHSALGLLKEAAESDLHGIGFVTPEQYRCVADQPWNKARDAESFIVLSDNVGHVCLGTSKLQCDINKGLIGVAWNTDGPKLFDDFVSYVSDVGPALEKVSAWIFRHCARWQIKWDLQAFEEFPAKPQGASGDTSDLSNEVMSDEFLSGNDILGHLRQFILVVHDKSLPVNPRPYAQFWNPRDGDWYYIAGDDRISQQNFVLVSLFMTMMAVPPTTPPLTPTINVGAH